ncbi:hypothetical protein SAMN02745221_00959 [Thermosyntropha lipolytica DSM 11003]|uniref:Phosphate transport regulator n=1 Tax=Thermosyntropha lipolytica DSM 11003 TaxID=1123382 RepID=A0A1M5MLL5_9FIRM|nr:DUF47 family protein [Thermosyntropha lipolytica]SHG78270.1 hypothetical protein SAMN02745221_00959 [Thermosyntropha lipolytica DSM 11003]
MLFRLKPRDEKFFVYFNQMADILWEASCLLKQFLSAYEEPEKNLEKMNQVEEEGDKILSQVMRQLNSSLVTPFDREDILLLVRELNNVVDHIQGTMEKIVIYKAGKPKADYILKLAAVLEEAALEIKNAVKKLPKIREEYREIIKSCDKIRALEHEGDYLYRAGIALLFEKTENVVEVIKWKEIYEHLESSLDDCENVSNVLKAIAVKYV